MVDCPPVEELERAASGEVEASLGDHLSGCEACSSIAESARGKETP